MENADGEGLLLLLCDCSITFSQCCIALAHPRGYGAARAGTGERVCAIHAHCSQDERKALPHSDNESSTSS